MPAYSEKISIELTAGKDEALRQIGAVARNVKFDNVDCLEIRRHNSFFHLLAPTGKIEIKVKETEGKTILDCLVLPSIFTIKSATGFTILSILIWSVIFWFIPLNPYLAAVFVVHWIVVCFVALYLLVGFMAVLTVLLVIYNYSDFPILYIIVAWIVTLLIVHLTLLYNRSALRQYLISLVSRMPSVQS